ncbi:MAG: hypothetical protein JJE50_01560 [Actinomycetales bacterium]|nr:hypothetical protein [Actinomycetales bacterium]
MNDDMDARRDAEREEAARWVEMDDLDPAALASQWAMIARALAAARTRPVVVSVDYVGPVSA